MKNKKCLVCILVGTMVISMAGCKNDAKPTDNEVTNVVTEAATPSPEPATPEVVVKEVSINFEDGNTGFVALYTQSADADNSELSIVDYEGSKALQVKNVDGKVPYVAFDASSLLGAEVAKVATIEATIGTSYENGNFSASSGNIITWTGAKLEETKYDWSVYLESKNPNTAIAKLKAGKEFVADASNIFMLTLKTDNGVTEGNGNATMYIDNIRFLDASGNLIVADSSAQFVAPAGFESSGKDLSNLAAVTNAVNFEGFACTGDAWAQNGFDIPQAIIDALVPGSVIEIEYSSDSGDMWLVIPDATAGWMRVGDGTNSKAYINNSKNIAQITYEQIAQFCGEDKSTWGARLQCEASGAWEVYSVKVGMKAPVYTLSNPVEFTGFACKGDAWAQNGFDIPQEIIDALVPGSVIEVNYTSESGKMWLVIPDAAAGWMRVGDGTNGSAVSYNGKSYITYEQIAGFCGEDKSTWGARLQCESDTAWEVYGVRVGTAATMSMVSNNVDFAGFACTGDGWAQNGFEMPQEIIDALVPGSVISVKYTSESGKMWLVLPGAEAGWMRVGDGTNGQAANLDGICQVTYEQIAAFCGDDKSKWGTMLQCESDTAWEVYSVNVGLGQPAK